MLIFITVLILLATALALIALRLTRPAFRFFWLTAVGGALAAWLSTWLWLAALPVEVRLPAWQPADIFRDAPAFLADGPAWAFAISLTTVALAVLVTTVARQNFSEPLPWIGTLILTGLGVLAVTANNALTLVLIWAAIDVSELIAVLRSADGPSASDRVALAFSTRVAGIGLLLWANAVSIPAGGQVDFHSMAPSAGLYLILAAGLRLGVLPLHLPYAPDARVRRGFATTLRLVSAASSLSVLARTSSESVRTPLAPVLLALAALAALYGAWMWLRSPDELSGRPYWLIGLAALAISAALTGNPIGAVAWGCALILAGATLFLSSAQSLVLERVILIGVWGLSALPFSLTGSAWQAGGAAFWLSAPLLVVAQACLMAGFVRHALRRGARESMDSQPGWVRGVYAAGIGLILLTMIALGLIGWGGTVQLGGLPLAAAACALTAVLAWLGPRLRLFNPIRANWIRPAASAWFDGLLRLLSNIDSSLGRFSRAVSSMLEGDGGMMWALLFLALFVFFMSGAPG